MVQANPSNHRLTSYHERSKQQPFITHRCIPDLPVSIHEGALPLSSSSEETLVALPDRVERPLGDTEISYFLPSRANGVNDMYLHIGCTSPPHLVQRSRVRVVWAILRLRHPLLASHVEMKDYDDIKFGYTIPDSVDTVLRDADINLDYRSQSKDDLINSYLNGPRTLSSQRLSYLIVSQQNSGSPKPKSVDSDFLISAAHFIGDGMALHQFANDMFTLLGSPKSDADLLNVLYGEWAAHCLKTENIQLPSAIEERLPALPSNKWSRAISTIDFRESQRKLIGGNSFPRASNGERRTVIQTISFDAEKTKLMLAKCKLHGVTISSAMFAICNIAWARTKRTGSELPMMMYSALNMRPHLKPCFSDSYWFLAVGYFNVVLPTFLPNDEEDISKTFWHRARLAKNQCVRAAKNSMVISRSREMAKERAERARRWASENDNPNSANQKTPTSTPIQAAAPSVALLGLSLLGNLDGIYKHDRYSDIRLNTLTTGSRQRSGGMLMFTYTFVGKLWISFGFDENGFDKETVSKFWDYVLVVMDETLT